MNAREERGLIIAAHCKLGKNEGAWLVPSQSGGERIYKVNPAEKSCTCPDHLEGGHHCKHLYAVEIVMKREFHADGTVTDTREMKLTEKTTYTQNWPAYTKAQNREKDRIQELLFDLCRDLEEPPIESRGRIPHTLKDSIFAMVFYIYGGVSSRRFSCDLREAKERGYLTKAMPGLKIGEFMRNPRFTEILKVLIARSAAPLKGIETKFAIDSSGFGSSRFERWFDQKYGVTRRKAEWVKAHICSGVKTNIVTAVRILDKDAADSPQFAPLVLETNKTFTINEVSADAAYASVDNFETVASCGGTGYMAFKSNTTGAVGGLFQKMFHYFQFKQEEYQSRYHLRSNVESTFSMTKRKFGDSVRSKEDVAMTNEVLCKFLCHNLCVLNQEECELGIEMMFTKSETKPQLALMA